MIPNTPEEKMVLPQNYSAKLPVSWGKGLKSRVRIGIF
jgi:hypothetical protein